MTVLFQSVLTSSVIIHSATAISVASPGTIPQSPNQQNILTTSGHNSPQLQLQAPGSLAGSGINEGRGPMGVSQMTDDDPFPNSAHDLHRHEFGLNSNSIISDTGSAFMSHVSTDFHTPIDSQLGDSSMPDSHSDDEQDASQYHQDQHFDSRHDENTNTHTHFQRDHDDQYNDQSQTHFDPHFGHVSNEHTQDNMYFEQRENNDGYRRNDGSDLYVGNLDEVPNLEEDDEAGRYSRSPSPPSMHENHVETPSLGPDFFSTDGGESGKWKWTVPSWEETKKAVVKTAASAGNTVRTYTAPVATSGCERGKEAYQGGCNLLQQWCLGYGYRADSSLTNPLMGGEQENCQDGYGDYHEMGDQ